VALGVPVLTLSAPVALAQQVTFDSFSRSTTRTQTVTAQTSNFAVSNFVTRLIGRLTNGRTVFDQTYSDAFGSGLVQGALNTLRAAIASAGGPAVVILSPVRTASTSSSSSNNTISDQLTGSSESVFTIVTFGPDTVIIGDRGLCTFGGTASQTPSGCSLPGTSRPVVGGETNYNTFTVTAEQVLRTTTVTTTTALNETYEVVGVVTPVGGVHAALLRDASLGGERFLKRLVDGPDGYPDVPEGDGEPLFKRVWLETYGAWGSLDGSGELSPGYVADVYGVSAGLGTEIDEGLTLSAGIDVSWANADMVLPGDYAEGGEADLTQLGLALHKDWGDAEAGLAFTYGFGSFDTASGSDEFGGLAVSSTDMALFGVEAKAGVKTQLGGGVLTPHAGFIWVGVNPDTAIETGSPFALLIDGDSHASFRLFAGIDYAETFIAGQGDLTLKLSVRVLHELGDEGFVLNAAFASGGGSLPLELAEEGRTAGEIEAGLSYALGDAVSVYGGYTGRFSEGSDVHAAKAGVTVRF
jgi:hypothetical protein